MKKKIITDEAIEGTASVMAKRLAKSCFTPPRLGKMADVIEQLEKETKRIQKTRENMLELIDSFYREIKRLKKQMEEK